MNAVICDICKTARAVYHLTDADPSTEIWKERQRILSGYANRQAAVIETHSWPVDFCLPCLRAHIASGATVDTPEQHTTDPEEEVRP